MPLKILGGEVDPRSDASLKCHDLNLFGVDGEEVKILNSLVYLQSIGKQLLYPNPETKRLRTNKNRILLVMGTQISVDFSIPPLQKECVSSPWSSPLRFWVQKKAQQLFR